MATYSSEQADNKALDWWRGAVIYQVYPRSLNDSNQDGIGDIQGIVDKLDYIASLGVDAIWVSPFFKSPMKDFGYDISDYRAIDPMFGNMDDFDLLVAESKQRGIGIIIDQVLSHTSDAHDWFTESRADRTNGKADWYVWADAKPDGTAPNNWLSIFGGGAWEWEPRRQQYYLHNFLKSQPDLNFHNPAVQQAVLDNVEFWLKRGVAGLRLDAINFCFHDDKLRDNPAKPPELRKGRGFSEDNPYAYQYHYYNNTRPENLGFMEQIRALLDRYPGSVSLGEISSEDSLKSMAEYTAGDERLHMAYSFELLTADNTAAYIRETVQSLETNLNDGWPCWAIGNHDVTRVLSRWGGEDASPQKAKLYNAILGCLRGSICSYQGEELGLLEADVPFELLQDPYGITFWPTFKGRDGCRTPMPWKSQAEHGGFTDGKPWLPVSAQHLANAVDVQDAAKDSVLNHYRQFFNWRKQQQVIREGDIRFVNIHEDVLTFERMTEQKQMFFAFNLTDNAITLPIAEANLSWSDNASIIEQSVHGTASGALNDGQIVLPEWTMIALTS